MINKDFFRILGLLRNRQGAFFRVGEDLNFLLTHHADEFGREEEYRDIMAKQEVKFKEFSKRKMEKEEREARNKYQEAERALSNLNQLKNQVAEFHKIQSELHAYIKLLKQRLWGTNKKSS